MNRRLLGVLALAAVAAAPAGSVAATPLAVVQSSAGQWTPGDDDPQRVAVSQFAYDLAVVPLVVAEGYDAIHVNRDVESHNFSVYDPSDPTEHTFLFHGDTIGTREYTILPTSQLPVGDYQFTCTLHLFMRGTLTIQ
ncbi:MAG TPA: hypothetical protein VGB83_10235 [Actinomycetota bacterium]